MDILFNSDDITREAGIAIVLNTFMYADRCIRFTGAPAFKSVVDQMYAGLQGYVDTQKAAIKIVRDCLKCEPMKTDAGELRFVNFSQHMGSKYTGAYAAALKRVDDAGRITDVYVVFRGTGSGRWYDNGEGLSQETSKYQSTALRYFNDTLDSLDITDDTRIIVTGHSKGGNLSQYVTLKTLSEYRDRIKYCISFDGQGFSPELYENMRTKSFYRTQCSKMYSICGDNDYVNVLGKKVIPRENTVYIMTKTHFTDMYGAHSIVPQLYSDVEAHKDDFLYNFTEGHFNTQTKKQRQLAECSMAMSAKTMEMSQEERAKTCCTIMMFAEKFLGGNDSYEGLLGEKADNETCIGFLSDVYNVLIPFVTYAGKEVADDVFFIVLIAPDVKDKSLLTAPESKKLEYVVSSQETKSLYYLGLTLGYEIMLDSLAEFGYKVGDIISPEFEEKTKYFYRAFLKLSDQKQTAEKCFDSLVRYAAVNLTDLFIKNEAVINSIPVSGIAKAIISAAVSAVKKKIGIDIAASGCSMQMSMPCAADEAAAPQKKSFIEGTEGDDGIMGEDADELIMGYGGNDGIHGYGGDDEIHGGDGDDRVYGEDGDDKLYGDAGDDKIYGKEGNDFIDGGDGDDTLKGGSGNDTVRGSLGDDTLFGEEGNDTLCGGLGNDRYVFSRGFGSDTISDAYGGNIIEFRSISPDELKAVLNDGGDLVIEMKDAPDRIRIRNYSADKFDFVFDSKDYMLINAGAELAFARK